MQHLYTLWTFWSIFFLSSIVSQSHAASFPLQREEYSVRLSDANFEHETQMSTGQTTGSWLVWVHRPGDLVHFEGESPSLDFWTDHHIVLGSLNSKRNPSTMERIHPKRGKLPMFLLIHKGHLYKLYGDAPSSSSQEDVVAVFDWEKVVHFALEGYKESERFETPDPPSSTDDFHKFLEACKKEFLMNPYFAGYFLFFAMIILYQFFPSWFDNKTTTQSATTTKKKD